MAGKQAVRRAAPAWVPVAFAAGFLLLVWAAGSGAVDPFDPADWRHDRRTTTEVTTSPSAEPASPPTLAEATEDVEQTLDLGWLGDLIAWAILLGVGLGVLAGARWLWQHRWRPPPQAPQADFDVLPPERLAERLAEDADAQRAAMAEGEARNGIVQCWLRLQRSAAEAGVPMRPSQTSTEFTVRALHALDLDPRAIEQLARLYREARFSTHPLGEDARAAATAALETLHADLRSSLGTARA